VPPTRDDEAVRELLHQCRLTRHIRDDELTNLGEDAFAVDFFADSGSSGSEYEPIFGEDIFHDHPRIATPFLP